MLNYVELDGKIIPYKILETKNKNTYIRFTKDYIVVSKSKHIKNSDIEKLLLSNFNKYYNKFIILSNNTPTDDELILEGITYKINIMSNKVFKYELINNTINIYTNKTDLQDIKKLVYKDYLIKMINRLNNDVNIILSNNNIKTRPIKISYFKTKFGSYHRISDIIKLNIVLAKAEINYLYYVIMHEYAHTKVFNHSKDFYNLLEKLMPNYKYYDKNLKKLSIWI